MAGDAFPIATIDWLTKMANERPQEAATAAPALVPSMRVVVRNWTIRRVLSRFYSDMPKSNAAKALARDLADAPAPCARTDYLTAILSLNSGRRLAARQIINIQDGLTRHCSIVTLQD